jgi:hypothetical protein
MKTKKILGLGICALSLGMVAGVIGTRAAVEAKAADLEYVKLHIKTSAAGDFTDYVMTDQGTGAAGTSAASYAYTIEVEEGAEFTVFYKWSDGSDTWCDNKYGASIAANWSPAQGTSAENKNAIYSGTTKTFKITAVNPHSNWVDLKIEDASEESEKEYHLVGLGGNWSATSENKLVDASEPGYTAKIENVALAVGDTFKITEVTQNKWYGYDSGILISEANLGKIVDDGTNNHNFKVAAGGAGTYSVYYADDGKIGFVGAGETVADLVEPTPLADGYYIVGLGGDWTKNGALASDPITGEHVGDKYIKEGLALTHGTEFKIVGIKDDAIDWNDKIAVEPTKSVDDDQSANFVTANDHNGGVNVKAIAGGTFRLYVNSAGEIYVFGATTGRTAAEEVDEFILDFIAPNVTKPDGEGKYADWETCDDKYTTAKKVLERLSDDAQTLFLNDTSAEIQTARAAYKYWEAHKDDHTSSYNVAGLANSNPTLIITLSVIAGAAVAGAGIYLISKKRKHN